MAATRKMEIRFPLLGVGRGADFVLSGAIKPRSGEYAAPWAVNVRPRDPFEKRMRGGSRPGLTELTSAVTSRPPYTTAVGNLLTEAGANILTEAGDEILADSAAMPATYFLLLRQGKIYALSSGTVTIQDVTSGVIKSLSATSGSVPTGCTLGCVYRDRLVLTGADNILHASRQGDFADWDYGADVEDQGRAAFFQVSEAGQIGETVTALCPHRDGFLLVGTARETWIWKGDPTTGGLTQLSRHVGILSSTAWCKVDESVYFLSHDGLYAVNASGGEPQNVSEGRVPNELIDIDPDTTTIHLGYCHSERGVYIFLDGETYDWFYCLETKSFWPTVFASAMRPASLMTVDGEMVIVDSGGTKYTVAGDDDDGTAIASHLLIGPINPGEAGGYGQVVNLHGTLSASSADVTWRLVTGDSAEQAAANAKTALELYLAGNTSGAEAYVKDSGTLTDGRVHMAYPRVRAAWVVLWLQSTGKWAYESITLEAGLPGRWR